MTVMVATAPKLSESVTAARKTSLRMVVSGVRQQGCCDLRSERSCARWLVAVARRLVQPGDGAFLNLEFQP